MLLRNMVRFGRSAVFARPAANNIPKPGIIAKRNFSVDAGQPTVGAMTSGNYNGLPEPKGWPNFFTQNRGKTEAIALSFALFCTFCYNAPLWAMPIWLPMKRKIREADEKYGAPRYGIGKKLASGGF